MSKRNRAPIQRHTADPGFAFVTGDALCRHAQADVAVVGRDMNRELKVTGEDLGGIIASATNIALAIELYLKGLLIWAGVLAPQTHELPKLFSLLPPQLKQAIEAEYDRLRATAGPGAIDFSFLHAASADKIKTKVEDPSLVALLRRNANAFVTWRYIFTQLPLETANPPKYEFLHLGYAAQAIRAQVQVLTAYHDPAGIVPDVRWQQAGQRPSA